MLCVFVIIYNYHIQYSSLNSRLIASLKMNSEYIVTFLSFHIEGILLFNKNHSICPIYVTLAMSVALLLSFTQRYNLFSTILPNKLNFLSLHTQFYIANLDTWNVVVICTTNDIKSRKILTIICWKYNTNNSVTMCIFISVIFTKLI